MICHLQQGSHSWSQSPTEQLPGTLLCPEGTAGADTFAGSLLPSQTHSHLPRAGMSVMATCLLCRPQQFSPSREELGASSEWMLYFLEEFSPSPCPPGEAQDSRRATRPGISLFESVASYTRYCSFLGRGWIPPRPCSHGLLEEICGPGCYQLLFGEPGCALGSLPSGWQHPGSEQDRWGHSTRPREGDPQRSHQNKPAGVPNERQDSVLFLLPGK